MGWEGLAGTEPLSQSGPVLTGRSAPREALSLTWRGGWSAGRTKCLPGICSSRFQGNREESAAHTPSPPESQPRIRALSLTRTEVPAVTVKQPCGQRHCPRWAAGRDQKAPVQGHKALLAPAHWGPAWDASLEMNSSFRGQKSSTSGATAETPPHLPKRSILPGFCLHYTPATWLSVSKDSFKDLGS